MATCFTTSPVKWVPLSADKTSGTPNLGLISLTSSFATVLASQCVVGNASTHLVNLSIRTKQYLFLSFCKIYKIHGKMDKESSWRREMTSLHRCSFGNVKLHALCTSKQKLFHMLGQIWTKPIQRNCLYHIPPLTNGPLGKQR